MRSGWLAVGLVVACADPRTRGGAGPAREDEAPTGSTAPLPTEDGTTSTGDTGATPTVPLDCSIEPTVLAARSFDWQSSEDFTIGVDGKLYGVQLGTRALVRADASGGELLAADVSSWGRGTRFLPDGDLVVAEPDTGTLLRFDATTWARSVIRGDLVDPNGIAIGEDGFVYLTQLSGEVLRIDPDTGASTTIHVNPVSTDGISFAPDYRHLYWNSENGQVVVAELDAQGAVVAGPELLTTIDVEYFLDGMTVDACGNLYVIDMLGTIWLVRPDGTKSVLVDLSDHQGGFALCAVNFGNGFGAWGTTKLYVMSLQDVLFELEIGLPGKHEPHWP